MEDDVRRSREAGFERHLTKPVNLDALETAIQQVAAGNGSAGS
jgi:CheY-like chemotaxis protein